MNFEEIQQRSRELFRLEATDLITELESALLALEAEPASAPLINRAFRAMHTLKGSGATSGFQELSDFLHRVEDLFNAAREGRVRFDSTIVDLSLRISDAVTRYLAAAPADAAAVLAAARDDLTALLNFLPAASPGPGKGVAPVPLPAAPPQRTRYRVLFRPFPETFRNGGDPGMYLDDLRTLGECSVKVVIDRLPALKDLDPEASYLGWDIELETEATEKLVRDVFVFAEGECDLEITKIDDLPTIPLPGVDDAGSASRTWTIEFNATAKTLSSPGVLEALWRDLRRFGTLTVQLSPPDVADRPAPGLRRVTLQTTENAEVIQSAFIFLIDAQPKLIPPPAPATVVSAIPPTPSRPTTSAAHQEKKASTSEAVHHTGGDMLRVSAERLDQLVNLVGELVILRSQVKTACANTPNLPPELHGAAEALQTLSTEMRDVILNVRMMPIEQTFTKFRRLVRDLSRDLNKEVELVVEGGDTEMDKTVLDALADPLVHLVRNSLDHGLETSAERTAAGKSARGTLTLRAEQRGDRVLVTVRDDGHGLDPEKIRAKAVANGLLAPDALPSDAELFQLIFLPGFSTAERVSKLSGRGVGLDVVRRQVEQLRGKVEVRSVLHRGAEFRLSLPLTLAIIDGLMVEVDGDRYILPLGVAREAIDLSRARREAGNGRNLVQVRGDSVPYLRLRDLFRSTSAAPDPERVVIVDVDDKRLGLVVDRVIGNHQTVLKSLGWVGRRVTLFSGATVLGDGRIALIIDVPALVHSRQQATGSGHGLET